jgi:cell division septation protein DedD
MNHRPKADVIKWLRGGDRARNRRVGYLLGCYGSSVVTGVICGFLLGNGWGHQPVTLPYNVRLPGTSTAVVLTPPRVSALDTISAAKVSTAQDPNTADKKPVAADKKPDTVDKKPVAADKKPAAAASQSSSPPPHTLPPVAKSRTIPSPPPAFSEPEKHQAIQPVPKPAKTLPPLTAPKSQSPSGTAYIVQVGAFGQAANAAQVVSQLKKDGYEAGLLKINKNDGNVLYRVYIARFSDESRAKAAAEVFRENQKRDACAVRYEPAL